ncbi:MAG TPA: ABC transporter permease [Longimicrobiales bacterium]
MLNRLRLWLRSNVLRRRLEREMQEEMASHVDQAIVRFMARGLSRDEARIEALREFGNVTYLQEQSRDARGWRALDVLRGDFRFALRQFGKRPVTTITMIAVLAVGMAVSTGLFALVHSVATMPPPGVEPNDDLVRLRGTTAQGDGVGARGFARAELEQLRALKEFESAAGWTQFNLHISAHDGATLHQVTAVGTFVTPDYFRVLDIDVPAPDSGTLTAVITESMWRRLFAKRPDIVGHTFQVNDVPVTIVGVTPRRFTGLEPVGMFGEFKLFLPMSAVGVFAPDKDADWEEFAAVARLRDGIAMEEAATATRRVSSRAAQLDPKVRATEVTPLRLANGDPNLSEQVRLMTGIFALLGTLVLLVTGTNVSAVLIGLGIARRREIAVRLSMGAGRGRIVRQLLTESVLLAITAATIGLALIWILESVLAYLLNDVPVPFDVTAPVSIFAFSIALVAGALFGLSPALHATRVSVATVLKESASTIAAANVGLQKRLVVAQIALTQPLIVLLLGMLTVIVSDYHVGENHFADNVVSLRMVPLAATGPQPAPGEAKDKRRAEMTRLRETIKRSPGVVGVAEPIHAYVPLEGQGFTVHPQDSVRGAEKPKYLHGLVVSPGFFEANGITLVRGRNITVADKALPENDDTATVPIWMDAGLAKQLWPGVDPIGRRFQKQGQTLVVTGLTNHGSLGNENDGVFMPVDSARRGASLGTLIRTTGPGKSFIPTVQALVGQQLPGRSIRDVRTLADIELESRRGFVIVFGLLVGAGAIALFIAAVGLFAVVSFSVTQRIGEIAVRVAHGALRHQIVLRFIGSGLRLSGIGAAIGLPITLIALRILSSVNDDLPEIPVTGAAIGALLGGALVSLAATWVPAQRAAGVDPVAALRSQ